MISAPAINGHSSGAPSTQTSLGESSQLDVLDLLRRRRGLVILAVLLGLMLAVIYCATTATTYVSDAQILVIPKDSRVATSSSNAQFGFESTAGDELLATHMQIILSPRVVKQALENRDLFKLRSIREHLDRDRIQDKKSLEKAAVDYVTGNLFVVRGGDGAAKDAQVLITRFQHSNAEDCSSILNAVIESYQDFLGETVQGAGDEAASLITEASQTLEERVKGQDTAYREFLQRAPILWDEGSTLNPHQLRLTQLETELSTVRVKRSEVESRLSLANEVLEDSDRSDPLRRLTIFDGADIDRLTLLIHLDRGYPTSEAFAALQPERAEVASVEYDQLLALSLQIKKEALSLGVNHPKYLETKQQIEELTGFLDGKQGENPEVPDLDLDHLVLLYERLLKNDQKHLQRRERELQQMIADEHSEAKDLITFELQEAELRRAAERSRTLYEAVVARLGEINLLKDYGGYITEVISPVEIGRKAWPKIPMVLALGTMLGMFCGVGAGLIAEIVDQSFRNPRDVERQLGVPVLTHVPDLTAHSANVDVSKTSVQPTVVALHQPKSKQAEAFRSLRTSIFYNTKEVANPVIQVTSPKAGDGKSTLTANLAVSIAQTSKSVLLVDCDLRRPTAHDIFGIEPEAGMSAILSSAATIDQALVKCDEVPGLSIIPAGDVPDNPAELLTLPTFGEFISEVRSRYDYVLIDSPPTLPVSDPANIASRTDFVLIALTLGKDTRSLAADCVKRLTSVGGNIMGLMVNRSSDGRNGYGHNYGYNYGYNYAYRYGYGQYGGGSYSAAEADSYYG